jgi:hypothetical protein
MQPGFNKRSEAMSTANRPLVMRKGFLRIWILAGLALAISWQDSARSYTSKGYLAEVGPAPLRFQAVLIYSPSPLPPLPEEPAPEPIPMPQSPEPAYNPVLNPDQTELPDKFFTPASLFYQQLLARLASQTTAPEPSVAPADPSDPQHAQGAASDLLSLPPEMLVEYFKPFQGATNGAYGRMLLPLQFMPAQPASPGSKATYKVQ